MTAKFSRDMSGIGFRVKGHIIDAAAVILTAGCGFGAWR
jgi:hypothetical protein